MTRAWWWWAAAPVAVAVACQAWTPESAATISYPRRVMLSVNQTVNTILGGQPDETISSRLGRTRATSRLSRVGCWVLDKVDPCHCSVAVELDADGNPEPHQFSLRQKDK